MASSEAEGEDKKPRKNRRNPNAIHAMTKNRIIKTDAKMNDIIAQGEKLCPNCQIPKPLLEFQRSVRKNGSPSFFSWCKKCTVIRRKAERLQGCFNLSLDDNDTILVYQDERCAICRTPMTAFKRALATDHDHKTGLIRGKLCWYCNKLLGIAQDDPERLLAAALYLIAPPAVAALGTPRFGLPGRAGTKKQRKLARKIAKEGRTPQVFISQDVTEWLEKALDKRRRM